MRSVSAGPLISSSSLVLASIGGEGITDRLQAGRWILPLLIHPFPHILFGDFEGGGNMPDEITNQQTVMPMIAFLRVEVAQDLALLVLKHNDEGLGDDGRRL